MKGTLALSAILLTAFAVLQVSGKPFPQQELESNSEWASPDSHVNNGRQSNKMEDIDAEVEKARGQIDESLILSGLKKFSETPDDEKMNELNKMATPEERDQMVQDLFKITAKTGSDPTALKLYTQYLKLNYLRKQNGLTTEEKEEIETQRTAVIQELDKIFANEPAWGRYWRFFANNFIRYMKMYG